MIAFVFPGQGSQTRTLFTRPDAALAAALAETHAVLGYDLHGAWEREENAGNTRLVQVALLVAGVASARTLAEHGIVPGIVAGHSVGAFGAAVASGALAFADALRIVDARGRAMRDAFPAGYGMGAVVGLRAPSVERLIAAEAAGEALAIAVVNAPTQLVVAGTLAAIDRLLAAARANGAASARRLDVAVPSHTEAFRTVAADLRARFADVAVVRPTVPVILGSTGRRTRDARALRDDLFDGVARRVHWDQVLEVAVESGAGAIVAMRPGDVLRDLAMRAFPEIRALALDDGLADVLSVTRGVINR